MPGASARHVGAAGRCSGAVQRGGPDARGWVVLPGNRAARAPRPAVPRSVRPCSGPEGRAMRLVRRRGANRPLAGDGRAFAAATAPLSLTVAGLAACGAARKGRLAGGGAGPIPHHSGRASRGEGRGGRPGSRRGREATRLVRAAPPGRLRQAMPPSRESMLASTPRRSRAADHLPASSSPKISPSSTSPVIQPLARISSSSWPGPQPE